jgi:arginyl-tRNA synthetase
LIENKIRTMLRESLESLGMELEIEVPVERPRESSHGDISSPVAMVLASRERSDPRKLARAIVDHLPTGDSDIEDVQVEGPGFINFTVSSAYYRSILNEIVDQGDEFGRSEKSERATRKVMVEFVSSNPTGPLTIGHGRQAVLGDVISNLLVWDGQEIVREYYFNDAGRQMDLLGRSVYGRYAQFFDPDHPFPEDGYRGDYINDIAATIRDEKGDSLFEKGGAPKEETIDYMRRQASRIIVKRIEEDLREFRISFDSWYNESSLITDGRTARTIERLRDAGAVYEKDGATWFEASRFGDTEDRVLIKSGGEHTYFLTDIAYHETKSERGFEVTINLHGADHHGYVPRMKAAMRALGYPDTFMEYLVHQMVTFMEGGKQLKMSTRAGTFITLRELMEKVGIDVARYFFVMIKPDSHLVFDLDLARSQSLENPVYYLQYANARISSILEFAEKENYPVEIDAIRGEIDLELLGDQEMELIKQLSLYSGVIRGACDNLEPHRLTNYLEELASIFHHWYAQQRVVVKDRRLTLTRLFLCHSVRIVLRSALKILGVTIPDRM